MNKSKRQFWGYMLMGWTLTGMNLSTKTLWPESIWPSLTIASAMFIFGMGLGLVIHGETEKDSDR